MKPVLVRNVSCKICRTLNQLSNVVVENCNPLAVCSQSSCQPWATGRDLSRHRCDTRRALFSIVKGREGVVDITGSSGSEATCMFEVRIQNRHVDIIPDHVVPTPRY